MFFCSILDLNCVLVSWDVSSIVPINIGSASYRKVDTLKGRNEEFGFGNGNRFNIGINSKAQTSRNRKRYTQILHFCLSMCQLSYMKQNQYALYQKKT
jgi:hypothetical protein